MKRIVITALLLLAGIGLATAQNPTIPNDTLRKNRNDSTIITIPTRTDTAIKRQEATVDTIYHEKQKQPKNTGTRQKQPKVPEQ